VGCDVDAGRRDFIAQRYPTICCVADSSEIFEDPEIDAVSIATPVKTHFDLERRGLEAGKAVLLEKLFTADVRAAESLLETARGRGLVLMVDHVFVYSESVRQIKELVAAGELRDLLLCIEAAAHHRCEPWSHT
jgi:predicted dehydrogenase